jgi:hypothetical protein
MSDKFTRRHVYFPVNLDIMLRLSIFPLTTLNPFSARFDTRRTNANTYTFPDFSALLQEFLETLA